MTAVNIPAMPPRVQAIMKRVCEHYRISLADLLGKGATQREARPRFVVAHLLRTGHRIAGAPPSLPQIGRWMNRDHTSVHNMLVRFEELRDELDWREDVTWADPAEKAPIRPPAGHRLQMRQDMAEAMA